jgi:hypothetical protein
MNSHQKDMGASMGKWTKKQCSNSFFGQTPKSGNKVLFKLNILPW